MGDGKKLKEIIDKRGINVRELSRRTGINHSSLYTLINRDSNLRFDYALRIANELDIDVNEICSTSPFSGELKEEEIYPTLPDGLKGTLDSSRVKTYLKYSLYPLMHMYGKNAMPDVDHLLTNFYRLNDDARKNVVGMIDVLLQNQTDPERDKQIKQIKGW